MIAEDAYLFPTSFAQRRLWFLDQLVANNPFYNIPAALRLQGNLNRTALERALNEIARRHEMVRTYFALVDEVPMQVVLPEIAIKLSVVDLGHLPSAERETRVLRLAREEARRPFDLARAPLLRAHLLLLAEQEAILFFTMHHIISDGWSMEIFFRELATLYNAFLRGQPSPLGELPIQYADYVIWQQERLQGEFLAELQTYWREHLQQAPAVINLPTDHPRPAVQSFRGADFLFEIPLATLQRLHALSRQEGTTLFITLLATFQILLARYTGQQDIVIGTPIAGRTQIETENLIGFFVNTLALRTSLKDAHTFRDVLARARRAALEGYAHQEMPFEQLVEMLQPERNLSHNPLFQVMFILQNTPPPQLEFAGLTTRMLRIDRQTANFDLNLSLTEHAGGMTGILEYSTDLFEEATIARLVGHFQVLLDAVLCDPGRSIHTISLLTTAEQQQLFAWNATDTAYPRDLCIQQLFEAQVERCPDALAVCSPGETLTYRDLNARANQLAHHLRALGVGPGTLVALYMERAVEMIPAVLGILKVGAAYVPLDMNFPPLRLHWILSHLAIAHIVTQKARLMTLEKLGHLPALRHVICLDHSMLPSSGEAQIAVSWQTWLSEDLQQAPTTNITVRTSADSLAYIIFTSGSTGTPKGVMVSHRPVINLIQWVNTMFALGPSDQVLFITSLCFDLSVYDIFGLLAAGGSIRVALSHEVKDPMRLLDILCTEPITYWDSAPAAFQQLVPFFPYQEDNACNSRLRLVFFSGDWIPVPLPQQLRALFPAARVIALGGATEATVWSNYYPVGAVNPAWASIPYGKPIPNARYYILDSALNPCPVGITGDLYIGGECLSLGYVNDPLLTAEKYIPDPFSAEPGMRLYKTGDLARFFPDGNIEFLGRKDYQVKIRGFRIETGEIEAILREHAAIRECCVVVREDASGDKRLVAYVVVESNGVSLAEILSYVKEFLPEYMVPSAFVQLEHIPLTSNGKVDRSALPAPDWRAADVEGGSNKQKSPIEELLANVWAQVLGLEQIGLHDDFFAIGGHSLLATQVISRIQSIFHIKLPLRSLFESPTVAELTAELVARQRGTALPRLLALPAALRQEVIPLSFAQQRLWFLDQLHPHNSAYLIPTALHLSGPLDRTLLEQSIQEIVRRHATLRTTFSIQDGRPVQTVASAPPEIVKIVDLQEIPDGERSQALHQHIAQESLRPFDLRNGPLLRVVLLRLSEQEHVLVLVMHHIISDGWSLGIFLQELEQLYTAYRQGKASPLPELPLQYTDYTLWQRQQISERVLEEQIAYWRAQLSDLPPLMELLPDYPRPHTQTYHGACETLMLSSDLTRQLRQLCLRESVTLFMVLLAAFNVVLWRHTGQGDIAVGTPIAGRTHTDTEKLIGFFVNTLVLRTKLAGTTSFQELVRQVREVALEAYAHQDVPFEQLVEVLRPERSLSHTPFFQVMFNMLNFADLRISLPGLEVTFLPELELEAKFDLTLYVEERSEGLHFDLVYNTDLFDKERIRELLHQYQDVLSQAVVAPEQPLDSFPLLTAGAREYLPSPEVALNADWPETALARFVQQAHLLPNRVAVVDEREQWTYHELHMRSNQLAHYLVTQGIQAEEVVAIYGQRNAGLLWAILGVLKAGAAFMLLDPTYPLARLRSYMHQARSRGLILTGGQAEALPALQVETLLCQLHVADTADIRSLLETYPVDTGERHIHPDGLAYLEFTSGSTGEPKGVLHTHRPLGHFLNWHCKQFGLGARDRFSLLSGLSFDPALRDIFTPLWLGATLSIPGTQDMQEPDALLAWLRKHDISVAHMTPALGQFLANARISAACPRLRYIFFSGDVLSRQMLMEVRQFAPLATCVNFYGTTETPQAVSFYQQSAGSTMRADEALPEHRLRASLPLGCGIADTQVLVLNTSRQLAGIGEIGEICIRTPYLARGYLNDQQRTQERFIVNPWTQQAIDRIYCTGDLGRYLPGGTVAFLGRQDQQVKIRGFRIEPGEIEAVLNQHPAIRHCAVIVCGDPPEETYLAAYVVVHEGEFSQSALLAFLRTRLPEHMLPRAVVVLDALPLTPNGKVDRRALPPPERQQERDTFLEPRTPLEEILEQIWADLLGIPHVSINDNFFELGGHSLLATQMVSRIYDRLQIEVPLAHLFETPTIAGIVASLQAQAPHAPRSAIPPLCRIPHEEHVPLSFAQQRLWFFDQLEPDNPFYNIAGGVLLRGRLNIQELERSLHEIVRRHEALRTAFQSFGDGPVQVIAATCHVPLHTIDLADLAEELRQARVQELARAEASQPFDLKKAPLIRTTLVKLSSEDHVLLITMHHIVSDGWSLGRFVLELTALYRAFVRGQPSPLPSLPVQYADYALWQRQWLHGQVLEEHVDYWRRCLAGAPALLELPTDHPRPAVQRFRGARSWLHISSELKLRLQELSQNAGVTLFMTLLAAFHVLLARYSGKEDIVVGTGIANRSRTEIEALIGFFANTLVMRCDLAGSPSFREVLRRVQRLTLEAYEHQDIPFEYLVEQLEPERNVSYTPLFQVSFVFQKLPSLRALDGLTLELLNIDNGTAKFDLTLYLWDRDDALPGVIEYNTDLFERATIERFIEHWQTLLERLVDDPDQCIWDISLLSAAEQARLLEEWRVTRKDAFQSHCLHELFALQARQHPLACALISGEQTLTYAELDRHANQLARFLREQGVGPEVLVGLYVERSLEMVIGLLGILKAGGAFVPLAPDYPPRRLAFMLEDANISIVLTQQKLVATLPVPVARVVCLDTDSPSIARFEPTDPVVAVLPENCAYVIYTSGSTGVPKGVQVAHYGLTNVRSAQLESFRPGPGNRVLQFSSLSFDASVFELVMALTTGATLVLAPQEGLLPGAPLLETLRRYMITHMVLTPSALSALPVAALPLQKLILAGEACPQALVAAWMPHCQVFNAYGPTEATIWATLAHCLEPDKKPAIGRPLPNVEAYVLDHHLRPLPAGLPGELYIGGVGLSRGYLGRPDLTAERFLPHPFRAEPGSRLYKTGDLARYLPDGNLEFLGRVDQQVKLRGFRIELDEIAAVARQHPAVKECVVRMSKEQQEYPQLVAYLVPDYPGLSTLVQEEERLPDLVEHWQTLYDETYRQLEAFPNPTFNITGWNNSYDDQPFPAAEMQEWVDQTVARIASWSPKRILEVGCGSGLLLFRLAPTSLYYHGTDISGVALEYLHTNLAAQDLSQVRLSQGRADKLSQFADESLDTIILNSVVQYFPDVDYLVHTLEGAVRALAEGGRIFVGDVRNLPLLEAFHTSVQCTRAPASLSLALLREQIRQRVAQEEELVIDPAFFFALRRHLPAIQEVEVFFKRGVYINELTKYRYDVILHVGRRPQRPTDFSWLDWQIDALSLNELRQLFAELRPSALGIRNVPNARLAEDLRMVSLLAQASTAQTVAELRAQLHNSDELTGVDPEALYTLGEALHYNVEIRWPETGDAECYDVLFHMQGAAEGKTADVEEEPPASRFPVRPWTSYANHPLQGHQARQCIPLVRRFLRERLPEYMLPSAFVLLETLPLTPGGKLDYASLPPPRQMSNTSGQAFIAPRSTLEEQVHEVWCRVLGLERISIDDNFFEIGGHSLLATQVVARLSEVLPLQIPLRMLFEHPTISDLSAYLVLERAVQEEGEELEALLAELEQLPEREAQALLQTNEISQEELS